MADSKEFKLLENQYAHLDSNYDKILSACNNAEEREKFRREYTIARDNFWEARRRVFLSNDPLVKTLFEELKATQAKIEQMTANLQNIVALLDTITAGVRLASSLIILGSSFV